MISNGDYYSHLTKCPNLHVQFILIKELFGIAATSSIGIPNLKLWDSQAKRLDKSKGISGFLQNIAHS